MTLIVHAAPDVSLETPEERAAQRAVWLAAYKARFLTEAPLARQYPRMRQGSFVRSTGQNSRPKHRSYE